MMDDSPMLFANLHPMQQGQKHAKQPDRSMFNEPRFAKVLLTSIDRLTIEQIDVPEILEAPDRTLVILLPTDGQSCSRRMVTTERKNSLVNNQHRSVGNPHSSTHSFSRCCYLHKRANECCFFASIYSLKCVCAVA